MRKSNLLWMRGPAASGVTRTTAALTRRPSARKPPPCSRWILALALLAAWAAAAASEKPPLERIKLPAGFSITILADDVRNARQMALGANGTLFVGSGQSGRVYALRLQNNRVVERATIASDLKLPIGVAFRDGALYVSDVSRILRFDGIEDRLKNPPKPVIVTNSFPAETSHGGKFIAFGPDGMLYVPVGAPCNICNPDPERYANIMRMKPDGSGLEVFARGVRNTVGFDWHPQTRELWFTENGRDGMGDDLPDDELNRAPQANLHFGYPFCHAGDVPDPQFGRGRQCAEFVPPAQKLGAHVAALGMRFYTGAMFPTEYRNNIFIAQHGSWDRSRKIGYRLMRVVVDGARVARYETFAEGWLLGDQRVWGRPVDVMVMPDGALLVSDDLAGVIYRITYGGS